MTLEQFKKVVESQLARIEAMKAQGDFVDYEKLDKIIITQSLCDRCI